MSSASAPAVLVHQQRWPTVSRCAGRQRDGRQCGAPPIRGEPYCLWHSPEREEEAAEARRLGGLRRKRERTVAGTYELEGLASVPALRRILEVVAVDTLVARQRHRPLPGPHRARGHRGQAHRAR